MKPETVFIDSLPCLSVTQLRNNGMLIPGRRWRGTVGWQQSDSCSVLMKVVLTVNAATDTPYIHLSYNHGGEMYNEVIALRLMPSNLPGRNGYYLFICPVTGVQSRKLYFHEGRFVNRVATGCLYLSQHRLAADKTPEARSARNLDKLLNLTASKHRKQTYRGSPTRYAQKLGRLESSL